MKIMKIMGIGVGCLLLLILTVELYERSLGSIAFYLIAIIFFIAAYRLNK